jgi:hypothetical protein
VDAFAAVLHMAKRPTTAMVSVSFITSPTQITASNPTKPKKGFCACNREFSAKISKKWNPTAGYWQFMLVEN